ncbi:MAG: hypothetical protein ACSHWY_01255 [Octadecabacter sp.]
MDDRHLSYACSGRSHYAASRVDLRLVDLSHAFDPDNLRRDWRLVPLDHDFGPVDDVEHAPDLD